MKRILSLIISISITSSIFGQNNILSMIEKGKFSKAEKKIEKGLLKEQDNLELNFYKSNLFIQHNYKNYSIAKSYDFLLKSEKRFYNISDEKVINKLNKIPINKSIFQSFKDTICKHALEDALRINTVESYQSCLDYYTEMPITYKNEVIKKRNSVAFLNAKSVDDIDSYKTFIRKYPVASEVYQAWERIHELAFQDAQKVNTSSSYKKFINEYPASTQYKQAFRLYEEKQYYENTETGNWKSYKSFIEDFPRNSWVSVAQDSILSFATKSMDMNVLKYCSENFPGNKKNKALLLYHDLYTNDGETSTLNSFYSNYDDDIFENIKDKDYEIAEIGNDLELDKPYESKEFSKYDEYIRIAAPREKAFVALQRMISLDIAIKDWKSALDKIKTYSGFFGVNNKKISGLISILESKWDNSIKIISVGNGINTIAGGEYVPVISADDKLLYFCGRDRKDNIGGEDIFVSKKINGCWAASKIIEDLSSLFSNDAPLSVTTDGTVILLFKSGDLYYDEKTIDGWSEAIKFPEQINSGDWQADAMISSDGKALLFASIREGGYNLNMGNYQVQQYHGDILHASDIYVSLLNENNVWGTPMNLGDVINTTYCDRMPFLHPDMKTLYFSSDGHGGLGKMDVFKSTRLADSCWNCWSEPINMGKEINTEESDWGYKISTDGEKAYFSKRNSTKDNDDIYWLNLPNHLRPDMVATVSGKLIDKNKKPVSAEIRWEDLETGKNVGQSKSDPADGSFFIVLPMGKIYGYYVDKNEYFPISNNIDLRNNNKPVQIEENIDMITFKQMIDDGTAVPVNNLFFNFAASSLLPYSLPELKRVASVIKANNLKVEISGHTDDIGEDDKNLVLSEQRAATVKDFLISEGCPSDRLITVGFGESKPVASNNNETGRAKNRRVELRFIK